MLLHNLQIIFYILVYGAKSHYLRPEDIYSEEAEELFLHHFNDERAVPFGYRPIPKHRTSKHKTIYSYGVGRPIFEMKSSQTKSNSYHEYIEEDDQELQQYPFDYFENKANIKNTVQKQIVTINYQQSDTSCHRKVKITEDIAALFPGGLNIPKQIFPICCKERKTTAVTPEKVGKSVTHEIIKGSSEHCATLKKKIPTTKTKMSPQIIDRKPTLSINTIKHQVTNKALINLVIQVKCDHHSENPPTVQQKVDLTTPVTEALKQISSWTYRQTQPIEIGSSASTLQFQSYLDENSEAKSTDTEPLITKAGLHSKPICAPLELRKIKSKLEPVCVEKNPSTTHSNDIKCEKNETSVAYKLQPHPLQPHDITIKFTRPTVKVLKSYPQRMPMFLCQITTKALNKSGVTKSKCGPFTPKWTNFEKITIPSTCPVIQDINRETLAFTIPRKKDKVNPEGEMNTEKGGGVFRNLTTDILETETSSMETTTGFEETVFEPIIPRKKEKVNPDGEINTEKGGGIFGGQTTQIEIFSNKDTLSSETIEESSKNVSESTIPIQNEDTKSYSSKEIHSTETLTESSESSKGISTPTISKIKETINHEGEINTEKGGGIFGSQTIQIITFSGKEIPSSETITSIGESYENESESTIPMQKTDTNTYSDIEIHSTEALTSIQESSEDVSISRVKETVNPEGELNTEKGGGIFGGQTTQIETFSNVDNLSNKTITSIGESSEIVPELTIPIQNEDTKTYSGMESYSTETLTSIEESSELFSTSRLTETVNPEGELNTEKGGGIFGGQTTQIETFSNVDNLSNKTITSIGEYSEIVTELTIPMPNEDNKTYSGMESYSTETLTSIEEPSELFSTSRLKETVNPEGELNTEKGGGIFGGQTTQIETFSSKGTPPSETITSIEEYSVNISESTIPMQNEDKKTYSGMENYSTETLTSVEEPSELFSTSSLKETVNPEGELNTEKGGGIFGGQTTQIETFSNVDTLSNKTITSIGESSENVSESTIPMQYEDTKTYSSKEIHSTETLTESGWTLTRDEIVGGQTTQTETFSGIETPLSETIIGESSFASEPTMLMQNEGNKTYSGTEIYSTETSTYIEEFSEVVSASTTSKEPIQPIGELDTDRDGIFEEHSNPVETLFSIQSPLSTTIKSKGEASVYSSKQTISIQNDTTFSYGDVIKTQTNVNLVTMKTINNAVFTTSSQNEEKTIEQSIKNNRIKEVNNITDIGGGKTQFYYKNKWFITDNVRLWSFNDAINYQMSESFFKMARENKVINDSNIVKTIENLIETNETYDSSEEMPFELFSQSVLLANKNNTLTSSFQWSGINMTYSELLAILRISSYDSQISSQWGNLNWLNVISTLKQSIESSFEDHKDYKITDKDGSTNILRVFLNGTSIWKNEKLDITEFITNIQKLNSKIMLRSRSMSSPYVSTDKSFGSFVKNIFEQRLGSSTMYKSYTWRNMNFSWEDILAVIRMVNTTLSNINKLETPLNEQNLEGILTQFQSYKRIYYPDRTVYNIQEGSHVKPLVIFSNGTTEFNNKKITMSELSDEVTKLKVTQSTKDESKEVQHTIDLGGGKYQFYWKKKWYITDEKHIWPFENETSDVLNQTFFNVPENKTVNKDSIQKLLTQKGLYENVYETREKMPFELFSQSVLFTGKFSNFNLTYHWEGYSVNYKDILAMLRLSSFNSYSATSTSYWGQMNWKSIYETVTQSAKFNLNDAQQYKVNYNGSTDTLTVYSNGTTVWKNKSLDIDESLTKIQNLNSKSEFYQIIIEKPYESNSEVSFEQFLTQVNNEFIEKKRKYTNYVWKNYTFTWEKLVAITRILSNKYSLKQEKELTFSKIVLPILSALNTTYPNSTVFNMKTGSNITPLIIYQNGASEYNNVISNFNEVVESLNQAKKTFGLRFVEDLDATTPNVQTKITELTTTKTELLQSESVPVSHNYDWLQFKFHTNNTLVYYPINLGGGIVQFYMSGNWYFSNGLNIWAFGGVSESESARKYAKKMNQTFPDNLHLNKATLRDLIFTKSIEGADDLSVHLVLPLEVLAQHILFMVTHDPQQTLESGPYSRKNWTDLSPQDIIAAVIFAAYNNSTSEIELPWSQRNHLNWDWIISEVKKAKKKGNEYHFKGENLKHLPTLFVYPNASSEMGDQTISALKLLEKLVNANRETDFSIVQVMKEFKTDNETFNWFVNEALTIRLKKKSTYLNYVWKKKNLSWYEILVHLRYSDGMFGMEKNDKFWDIVFTNVLKSKRTDFHNRIEYIIEHIPSPLTVFMNETSIYQELVVYDIGDYIKKYAITK